MDPELYSLIQATKADPQTSGLSFGRAPPADTHTHMSMWGPCHRWTIRSDQMSTFWSRYCEIVDETRTLTVGQGNWSLAERPQEQMPIICESILRFQNADIHEAYGNDFILAVIACYQTAMLELLQITESSVEFICCVLESVQMWEEPADPKTGEPATMAHQFRLQFPYCKTSAVVQSQIIRPRAIQLLREQNVISRLPQQPINDWEAIINAKVAVEPLTLYRSTSASNRPRMEFRYIYGPILEEHIEAGSAPVLELTEVFQPSNHNHVQQGIVSVSTFADEQQPEHWIPLFLSVNYWIMITLPKERLTKAPRFENINGTRFSGTSSNIREDETEIELAEQLIAFLLPHRLEKRAYWLEIGRALYSACKGEDDGLELWIRWSLQSDGKTDEECRNLYATFRDSCISLKTIAWYAREDSPDDYEAWHLRWCLPVLEKAISCLHNDVAKALYRVYWLQFTCASMDKSSIWYHFENHRWCKTDGAVLLRKCVSADFLKRFEVMRTQISISVQETDDQNVKTTGEIMIKKIGVLVDRLKSVPFKANIIKEAGEFFYDKNFDRFADASEYIMGTTNGVIEVYESNIMFRKGKPEDFLTKATSIPYRTDLNRGSAVVRRLWTYLGQVFRDIDLLHHFLKMSASGIRGRNSDKVFPIWTGEGDNSKSMIVKLFEMTFGTYCIKFPTALLTGRRTQSSGAMPEVARSKSTRWAFLQEPDDEEEIKGGMLKELTGGDSFFARMLYDGGGEVEAFFKLVLMCNKPPNVPTGGKAVKNRLRIIPFLSTWINNPPLTPAEQMSSGKFKKDPFFEKQIPELAQAFLWLLVEYYPIYIREGLDDPIIVKEATDKYWVENDVYAQFAAECIRPATIIGLDGLEGRDPNVKMSLTEVYREFKQWHRSNRPNSKVPERIIVRGELVGRWGPLHGESWFGIKGADHLAMV
jgi:phage/plasmid-associated DNA primase